MLSSVYIETVNFSGFFRCLNEKSDDNFFAVPINTAHLLGITQFNTKIKSFRR